MKSSVSRELDKSFYIFFLFLLFFILSFVISVELDSE